MVCARVADDVSMNKQLSANNVSPKTKHIKSLSGELY